MKNKRKNKHNLWKRLNFKYRLSAMNESTLEEIWKIRTSIFSGIVLVILFATFLVGITSVIIIATPIRYYLPGYLDVEVRENAIRSAIKADSLELQLKHQEIYINNIRDIFAGNRQVDSVKVLDSISISANDPLLQKSAAEAEYVRQFEEEEKYNLSSLSQAGNVPVEGLVFFKPAKGLIAEKFNPLENRFGVTIKTISKETISATLDGTIIFAGFDLKTGYIIQIQHKNGFISIYKNSTMLLKKSGDKVRTGEAIAILDISTDEEKPSGLEFELWYRGSAVNPENYISF
ncbi:MAG: M23 family metallopeptidase [Prevotella sp.]|nr:M23 family metallopeptidase [Prevotella sp.]